MKKIRFIPFGYTMRDGRTIIDHDEADVIRQIFDTYLQGASLKEIAESLTLQKIPYTEKTAAWDKARIARILENANYIGEGEYDPIIDEDTYECALAAKAARQRRTLEPENEGIQLIRNRVKCAQCGASMVRRLSSKLPIRESWLCSNEECGIRVRISDGDLLAKIQMGINRIIENTNLLIPRQMEKTEDSPIIRQMQEQINTELCRQNPSEELILEKISGIASRLYEESQGKEQIAAQLARKRVALMEPKKSFQCDYFTDLITYFLLDADGQVILHTKTNQRIGAEKHGSSENSETNRHPD